MKEADDFKIEPDDFYDGYNTYRSHLLLGGMDDFRLGQTPLAKKLKQSGLITKRGPDETLDEDQRVGGIVREKIAKAAKELASENRGSNEEKYFSVLEAIANKKFKTTHLTAKETAHPYYDFEFKIRGKKISLSKKTVRDRYIPKTSDKLAKK